MIDDRLTISARVRRFLATAIFATALAGLLSHALPIQARAEAVVDEELRAALLKRPDGRIARMKTPFNEILIDKKRQELTMSFRVKGWDYIQSITNLRDADVLPLALSRAFTTSVVYPPETRRILMIGVGGASVSSYLGRAMPELAIDAVDIDPGVIEAAKQYFGARETSRIKFIAGDGRAFLENTAQSYDLILHDAYHGGGVPSRLLTREFYELMRKRLAPGGAAVYNIHDGTLLYLSTLKTLGAVFTDVHLYPSGEGEVIAVATPVEAPDRDTLRSRAAAMQERHKFRYPLPQLLGKRAAMPALTKARVLTDADTSGGSPPASELRKTP